jgi:membrane protein
LNASLPPMPRQPLRRSPLWRRVQATWHWWQALPDRTLFGGISQGTGATARLLRAARYPYALLRDLAGGQLNLHAMGLVYASLLSIIPLVALSLGLLKALNAEQVLRPLVHEFFVPMGREANQFTDQVMSFAGRVHGGLVGSLGFGLLIWTLLGTMRKVEDGFNFVWHVDVPRSFARRSAEYVTLLLALPLLLAALAAFSRLAADSTPVRLIVALPLLERLQGWLLRFAPYLLVCLLMTVLYVVIPNTRVRLRPALYGGIAAGILWAAVGRLFTLFVLYSARLTLVYAGFAIMIAALLWTYFGWTILLLGAQVSFYAQNPGYLSGGLREPRLSSVEVERLALGIMYLIAERARERGAPHTISSLSLRLEFPGSAVTRVAANLAAAGFLTSDDQILQLKGDAGAIGVLEILRAARNQRSGALRSAAATPAAVEAFCREFDAGCEPRFSRTTLRDLLESSG